MNEPDGTWLRTLMDAIEVGDADVVERLAPQGDLDVIDDITGLPPLALAVDAQADGARQRGSTPDLRIVRLLLSLGASPTLEGSGGVNAADLARSYGWHDALDLMHETVGEAVPRTWWRVTTSSGPSVGSPDVDGDTAAWRAELMDAIDRGSVDRVRTLVAAASSDLEFVHPPTGRTPLQLAVEVGADPFPRRVDRDVDVVRALVEAGASPFEAPDGAPSPATLARQYGWPEAIELFEGTP